MIPPPEQTAIRDLFTEHLTGPVKLEFFTQRSSPVIVPGREECQFCPDIQTMLEELTALSPKLSLRVHQLATAQEMAKRYGVRSVPTTVVRGTLNRPIRYVGIPSGYEFPVLIDLCIWVSRGETAVTAAGKKRLKRLARDVRLEVFVTPESEESPDVARAAAQIALENARIRLTITEIAEFPQRAESLGLQGVPTVLIDDAIRFSGPIGGDQLLEQVVRASEMKPIRSTQRGPGGATLLTPPDAGPVQRGETRPSGLIIPR